MTLQHEDAALTIEPATARELLARSTDKGRRLLVLFARKQILDFAFLQKEFRTNQNGLNALLGRLTREFQEIQGGDGFYIYLPAIDSWAIGHASGVNLRRAIRAHEKSRQGRIEFSGDS